ncbi:dopamine receptor 2-like [Actinia tenebrosa]|uniref:Dopamine receptor 2-like n=1 Tax=Actinia tenebrosa TaxID=6105 RepID=A0A6P8HYK9_ACTTE|nr:dopamine receptor 2-like [Actinia tenebrosa]
MNHTNPENCDPNLPAIQFVIFNLLQGLSGFFSIFGNAIVLFSITRTKSLQTVSNFYIVSLAIADLLVGLLMSPIYIGLTFLRAWPDSNNPLYKLENFFWIQTLVATTFSLVAVSIDRYLAITSVFRYHFIMTKQKTKCIIILLWTASFSLALPTLLVSSSKEASVLWVTCQVFTMVIPLLIIVFCYCHIFKAARIQIKHIASTIRTQQNVEAIKNRKAATTMAIVIGVFVMMYFPNFVFSWVEFATKGHCKKMLIYRDWLWAILLAFGNSACNPWIYALRMNDFKLAFRRILWGRHNNFVLPCSDSNVSR